jgi:hypothetical protein
VDSSGRKIFACCFRKLAINSETTIKSNTNINANRPLKAMEVADPTIQKVEPIPSKATVEKSLLCYGQVAKEIEYHQNNSAHDTKEASIISSPPESKANELDKYTVEETQE